MPTTSVKHRNFVGEAMGEKGVETLAGIGPVYGGQFKKLGFTKAYNMLGQFLLLNKDKNHFTTWLKDTCGMNTHHSGSCYECLYEWCQQHL